MPQYIKSATEILDETANNKTGTLKNGAMIQTVSGSPDVLFFGGNDYVEVPNHVSVSEGNFTVEFWAKPAGANLPAAVSFGIPSDWSANLFIFYLEENGKNAVRIYWNQNSILAYGTPGTYTDGNWYHFAFTKSGGTGKLYIDGVNVKTVTGQNAATWTSTWLSFGAGNNNGTMDQFYKGYLSDIRMWNYVRTQSEIDADKDKILTGGESGLVGMWHNHSTNNVIWKTVGTPHVKNGGVWKPADGFVKDAGVWKQYHTLINYGGSFQTSYSDIYSTLHPNGVPLETFRDQWNGNYHIDDLYNAPENRLSPNETDNGYARILSGTNIYNLNTNSPLETWVRLFFRGTGYEFSTKIDGFQLRFADGTQRTMQNALNNGYIEPLIIISSTGVSSGNSEPWATPIDGFYYSNTTGYADFPNGQVIFKNKDLSQITGFEAYCNQNWDTRADGYLWHTWNDIEFSIDPM